MQIMLAISNPDCYAVLAGTGPGCIPGPDILVLPFRCRLSVQQELELQSIPICVLCLRSPYYSRTNILRAGRGSREAGHCGSLICGLLHLFNLLLLLWLLLLLLLLRPL